MSEQRVIVVGGGPTGLAAALGLARQGVHVVVADRDKTIGTAPRALIHLWPTLIGFEALGVREDVERRGLRIADFDYVVWETMERIHVNHDAVQGIAPYPYGVSLGQDEITEIFLEHLRSEPTAEVLLGAGLIGLAQDESSVTAVFETDSGELRLAADWLIGADGADSAVRKRLGMGFDGMTWSDRFIATNLRGPFEALGHADANLVIDPVYGAILMRIGQTGMWRCTYKEHSHLPIASYLERVPAHLTAFTRGQIDVEVVASSPYSMHQRAADAFRAKRVLLAGDAAHITNPTGGLGLTAGFHDAFSLAETLGAVVRGLAPQDLLTTWADARRAAFYERISPAATANKQLLFDGVDPVAREVGIQQLRLIAGDEESLRNQLLLMAGAVTPSLVEQRHPEGASR